jgi:hypothetical protein
MIFLNFRISRKSEFQTSKLSLFSTCQKIIGHDRTWSWLWPVCSSLIDIQSVTHFESTLFFTKSFHLIRKRTVQFSYKTEKNQEVTYYIFTQWELHQVYETEIESSLVCKQYLTRKISFRISRSNNVCRRTKDKNMWGNRT